MAVRRLIEKRTAAAKTWPKRACHKSFRNPKPSFPLHPSSLTTVSQLAPARRILQLIQRTDDESSACIIRAALLTRLRTLPLPGLSGPLVVVGGCMITAFGTPFLLQERTLYGISDYQTGRCLFESCDASTIEIQMADWWAMYNTFHIIMQQDFQATRAW